MKHINIFLLFVLLLSSCAPATTGIPTSAPTQTITPSPTATQTPSPTPTLTPAPTQIGGGSGKLIFIYSSLEFDFEKYFPDLKGDGHNSYVFISNTDGTNLTPITKGLGGANSLLSLSPDGTKALIASSSNYKSKTSTLYLVNLNSLQSEPIQIAQNPWSAKWIDNTRIVYIGQGDQGFGIYVINADGTNTINIEHGNNPVEILAVSKDRVYWNTISTRREGNRSFSTYYAWWTNLDGSETGKLTYKGEQIGTSNFIARNIAFSPDGTKVAWIEAATATFHHNYLHIASVSDTEHPLSIDLITSGVDLKWRLDGKSILVFDWRSVPDSDKSSSMYGFYAISADSGTIIKNYHLSDETMGSFGGDVMLMRCGDISPDDILLPCLTWTPETAGVYDFHVAKLNLLNLETGTVSEINGFNFLMLGVTVDYNISFIP